MAEPTREELLATHRYDDNRLGTGSWLAACGDTDTAVEGTPTSTSPATAATPPDPTKEPSAIEASPSVSESTDDKAADADVTGLGATRAAWEANHEQAPGYTQGSAYLPMVEPDQPKYAAVCCDDQIVMYLLFLSSGTSLEEAREGVAGELPTDATPTEMVDKGSCTMQLWESPTLQEAVGSNAVATYFMDDPGLPSVTLSTGDSVADLEC